ncbi:tyrosine-type recombinase/integrase [Veillonella intestinalis]|uniref:tyrosine-type recombinase/integrase n=1 Tax=Veillonella intestinalis TaxID=2941341 RepID=UPI00203FD359|nr:tyrosine-type recombinase/integrase [Veillonella intestinalis]
MKLPNNYGQICKLSGQRRRPYMVRKTIGYENNGRAIYHIIGYYKTKTDALTALAQFNQSTDIPTPTITLAKIYKIWFASHSKQVSQSTANSYVNSLKHIGALATIPIKKIKHQDLQNILDNMSSNGLSYASLKKVRSLIHQLYKFAIINEWTDRNLGAYLVIGKNIPVRPHKPFTRRIVNKLWQSNHPDKWFVLTLLYSGMRSAEFCSHLSKNVNRKQKYFNITKSKTKSGIRVIPIHDKIWPYIEKTITSGNKYLLGEKPMTYAQFARRFNAVMKSIGANHTTHDCRHTFATWLDDAGANYNVKRRLLGHSANNVTDGVYTHKALPQLRKAIKLLK